MIFNHTIIMKILFLVNIPLPETGELYNIKTGNSGGWLISAAEMMSDIGNINLYILFPIKKNGNRIIKKQGKKITYFSFPHQQNKKINSNKTLELFDDLLLELKPDIVHIFGTELPHALLMLNSCISNNIKNVISLQGIVSKINEHFDSNLPTKVLNGCTFRNFICRDRIADLKDLYKNLSINEREILKKANHVIGRTTFDKTCAMQINSEIKYYYCNETLRESFYHGEKWNLYKCERYSIFLSQAHYPIKGLHYMIEALSIIIKKYPNTKLYIGGKNIIKKDSIKDKLLISYYGKYISKLIKKFKLNNNVIFLGPLQEIDMKERYINSNVFVCPSSIENSPNSLGEAMLLGVPSVASYVGGTVDMILHEYDGFLYQANAPYMLAHYIMEIFRNDELALKLSKNAMNKANNLYDKKINMENLLRIYNSIIE